MSLLDISDSGNLLAMKDTRSTPQR